MGVEILASIGKVASVAPRAGGLTASFGVPIGRIGVGIEGGFKMGSVSNPFKGQSLIGGRLEVAKNPFTPAMGNTKFSGFEGQAVPTIRRTFNPDSMFHISRGAARFAPSREKVNQVFYPYYSEPRPVFRSRQIQQPIFDMVTEAKVESKPVVAVKLDSKPQIRQAAENKTATKLSNQPTLKTEIRTLQVVEEQKVTKNEDQESTAKEKKSEKISTIKAKLVEAVQISEKRKAEIKAAIRKAYLTVDKVGIRITGKLVVKLLSATFWEYKSPIVGSSKDGSINPTVNELLQDNRQYDSEIAAEASLLQAVDRHIPVKQGYEGRAANFEEVLEVLEGKEKTALEGAKLPVEIVVKRISKKTVAITNQEIIHEEHEEKETSLKDFPDLEKVFLQEAA